MQLRRQMLSYFVFLALSAFMLAPMTVRAKSDPFEDANTASTQEDYAKAIPIYRTLAEKGDVRAQKRLAYLYTIGVGVKQDWVEAGKWLSKAADAGDEDAVRQLATLGRDWPFMYKNNSDAAIYALIERAAQQGYGTTAAKRDKVTRLHSPTGAGEWHQTFEAGP